MKNNRQSVDLSLSELDLIQSALHTQEKILSLQSRAGVDTTAGVKLGELKSILKRLSRVSPANVQPPARDCAARSLFG